jgi:hypothetical protein
MLLPMHPKVTTRLRITTLHTTRNVLLLYGLSYILALFLWQQVHFVYRPPTYQVVDDQRQAY